MSEAKKLVVELNELHAQVKSDRKDNIRVMESLIQGVGKTYRDLDYINAQIQNSISSLEKARVYRSRKWITSAVIVSTAFLIIFGSSISFAILAIQKSKPSGLIKYNPSQLTHN